MIKLWPINCLYSIVWGKRETKLAKHAKQPASHTATKWFAKFDSDTETTNSCKATFCCLSDCLSKAWQESFVRVQFSWNCETKLVSQSKQSLAQILRLFIMSLFAKMDTRFVRNCVRIVGLIPKGWTINAKPYVYSMIFICILFWKSQIE